MAGMPRGQTDTADVRCHRGAESYADLTSAERVSPERPSRRGILNIMVEGTLLPDQPVVSSGTMRKSPITIKKAGAACGYSR
jgi:hypothetical protein